MKRVILSFDYEIYFDGKNNYQALIENTNRILNISSEYSIRLVFFVDMAYLQRLSATGQKDAFNEICVQLRTIKELGHELQYHYHPHWINAKYNAESNTWSFNPTEFSFSDMVDKYGFQKAKEDFNSTYWFFKVIIQSESNAFRAGGLSINNHQDLFIQTLTENAFKFDSSVMPGMKMRGKYLNIDHTSSISKSYWNFGKQKGFFSDSDNESDTLIEIPILTLDNKKIAFFDRIVTSIKYRILYFLKPRRTQYLGGTFDHEIEEVNFPTSITFDGAGIADLIIMKHYTKEAVKQGKSLFCLLSHPKSFQKESFLLFNAYLKWIKSRRDFLIIGYKDIK